MSNKTISSPSADESRDAYINHERYAPLRDVRLQGLSSVRWAMESLVGSQYPEKSVSAFVTLVHALSRAGETGFLDRVGDRLKTAVQKAIQMVRDGASAKDVEAELRRSDGHNAETAQDELCRWFPRFVLNDVVSDKRFVEEHHKAKQAVDKVLSPLCAPRKQPGASLPEHVEVSYPTDDLAIVTRGPLRAEVRGESLVRVFRLVVQDAPRDVWWTAIREGWNQHIRQVAPTLDGTPVDPSSKWRPAPAKSSLVRYGQKIKEKLELLGYDWDQNGSGARYCREVREL